MKLNGNKIMEHKKDLEHHDGLVPLSLMMYIDTAEYIGYLRKKKTWDKIRKEMFSRRRKIQFMTTDEQLEFERNELLKWIKKNQEFQDIIKEE